MPAAAYPAQHQAPAQYPHAPAPYAQPRPPYQQPAAPQQQPRPLTPPQRSQAAINAEDKAAVLVDLRKLLAYRNDLAATNPADRKNADQIVTLKAVRNGQLYQRQAKADDQS